MLLRHELTKRYCYNKPLTNRTPFWHCTFTSVLNWFNDNVGFMASSYAVLVNLTNASLLLSKNIDSTFLWVKVRGPPVVGVDTDEDDANPGIRSPTGLLRSNSRAIFCPWPCSIWRKTWNKLFYLVKSISHYKRTVRNYVKMRYIPDV